MNILFPCSRCKNKESSVHTLSCDHHICYQCLIKTIFIEHINKIGNHKSIEITCGCDKKGTLKIDMNQLFNIFSFKPFINEQHNLKEQCMYHKNLELNLYCVDCGEKVCKFCVEEKGNEHQGHRIIKPEKFKDELKFRINHLPLKFKTLEDFNKNFENIGKELKSIVEGNYNKTLECIDKGIQNLKEFREKFINNYKKKIEQGIFNLKLIKLFYLNFYRDFINLEPLYDIEALKFLNNIQYELDNINIEYNDIILTSFEKYKKNLDKLEEDSRNCLNISYSFIKVPTEYKKLQEIPCAHKKFITSLCTNSDDVIFTGSKDYSVKSWEENDNEKKNFTQTSCHTELQGSIASLIVLKDKRIVTSASRENIIRVWEFKRANESSNYEIQQTLSSHNKKVCSMLEINDGRFVSAGLDRKIVIWEDKKSQFEFVQTIITHGSGEIFGFAKFPDGRFAYCTSNARIVIYKQNKDNTFAEQQTLVDHKQRIKSICYLKDNSLASGGDELDIFIWKEDNGVFKLNYKINGAHKSDINSIISLNDGRFASTSKDKTITIWKKNDKGEYQKDEVLEGHNAAVYFMVQLKDNRLCTTDSDGNMLIWMNKSQLK